MGKTFWGLSTHYKEPAEVFTMAASLCSALRWNSLSDGPPMQHKYSPRHCEGHLGQDRVACHKSHK